MDKKQSTYKGNTDAHRKANNKYLTETVETIAIRVPKGSKAIYKAEADKSGMSLNQFAIAAMDAKIKKDKLK